MSSKSVIHIGTKIDYLTVLEIVSNRNRQFCICKCDCGKTVERRRDYLSKCATGEDKFTSSCGCKKYDKIKGNKSHKWTGVGDLSGQYYASIKNRAQQKKKSKNRENGIEFSVSIEFLWNLFLTQNKLCAISGLPITLSQSRGKKRAEQTASLDRIDCSKGYVEDNVQWVHKDINKMRNTMTMEDFVKTCKIVANYHTA